MGLLDSVFGTSNPQGGTTGGLFSNPALLNAGLSMMAGATGQPGQGKPTFGQAALAGLQGYNSGMQNISEQQFQAMKMKMVQQQMEDEQRKRNALFGSMQDKPWANPDDPSSGPLTGGMIDNLPPEQRALAQAFPDQFGAAIAAQAFPKASDPTTAEQEYNLARQQGYQGTFMDYKAELAQSMRPQTNVNVNSSAPPMETEYDKAMGKSNAETYIDINKQGMEAASSASKYKQLGDLLSSPGVYQGAGGESVLQAQKIASSLGINMEGVGPAQAAQAISRGLALELRNPASGAGMPGAMSDSDREYLKSLVAGVNNTPEGNKMLIDAKVKVERRKQEVSKMARKYQTKNGRFDQAGFYEELQKWSDSNPLFGTSDADADALINKYK